MRRCLRKRTLVTLFVLGMLLVSIYPLLHIVGDRKITSNHVAPVLREVKFEVSKETVTISKSNNLTLLNQNAAVAIISQRNFSRNLFSKLFCDPQHPNWLFSRWLGNSKVKCEGKFSGYGGEVAYLTNVVLDNMLLIGKKGGEDFGELINQREDDEFFKYNVGYIRQECKSVPDYQFNNNNHLNKLMSSYAPTLVSSIEKTHDEVFLAITRYEYVNLYHTMTDFYNAFLTMTFFNLTQAQTNILILDGHPWGSLDPVWATLFNSVERAGRIATRTTFKQLVLGYMGYNSPLFVGMSDASLKILPLSEEFREFFLTSYDVPYNKKLECSKLNVLFIWRRPYIAHPRNPSGDVHRKIKNEEEVLMSLRKTYPNWKIIGAQTDALPMRDQLQLASQADIMIGMHGAALSLTMMLPKHAALFELMPKYINPEWKKHFVVMANWRHLIYKRWFNQNSSLELPNHYTIVPPLLINEMVSDLHKEMCSTPT